jgi:cellulose synthase/poly-beta-1,6-N-acetylglucosamine synthase-like glycosyltransferase
MALATHRSDAARPACAPTGRLSAVPAAAGVVGVLALLVGLVVTFYWLVIIGLHDVSWVTVGIAFMLGSDGLLLFVAVGRRDRSVTSGDRQPAVDSDVSVIIASYNGAEVVGQTIERVLVHAPQEQVIVVSDASTDDTADVARSYGVVVIENRMNRNKAFSISRAALMVRTEYTLILDDDTLVAPIPLPTDLLRDGYAAVAFDVMPIADESLVNRMQRFEYRKSMTLGKALLSSVGAISNVSGAVGLFRTRDLRLQASRHSGQFAGEDLQRTLLAHLTSEGSGIGFCSSRVETLAPSTWRSLFGQRAFKWGTADHEMLVLNLRVLADPRIHWTLRLERAYSIFVLLTDPLRMAFFFTLLLKPWYFVFLYLVFLPLELIAWLRVGRVDPLRVVLLAPVYNLFKMAARFVGHFYWFRAKLTYLRRGYHTLVPGRNLLREYLAVSMSLATAWAITLGSVAWLMTAAPTTAGNTAQTATTRSERGSRAQRAAPERAASVALTPQPRAVAGILPRVEGKATPTLLLWSDGHD